MPLSIFFFCNVLSFVNVPTTLCRINEPPIGRDRNVITDENLDSRSVTFALERDVYEGEELFIDYGMNDYASWCDDCRSDVNCDGIVDSADLGLLIGAWGVCS